MKICDDSRVEILPRNRGKTLECWGLDGEEVSPEGAANQILTVGEEGRGNERRDLS